VGWETRPPSRKATARQVNTQEDEFYAQELRAYTRARIFFAGESRELRRQSGAKSPHSNSESFARGRASREILTADFRSLDVVASFAGSPRL